MDARKQQHFDVEGGAPHGGLGTAPTKDFDDEGDLPITANRTAKWWYVAVHNITAMVGAGVLGLPYAMALLGELQVQQVALSPKLSRCPRGWELQYLCRTRLQAVSSFMLQADC